VVLPRPVGRARPSAHRRTPPSRPSREVARPSGRPRRPGACAGDGGHPERGVSTAGPSSPGKSTGDPTGEPEEHCAHVRSPPSHSQSSRWYSITSPSKDFASRPSASTARHSRARATARTRPLAQDLVSGLSPEHSPVPVGFSATGSSGSGVGRSSAWPAPGAGPFLVVAQVLLVVDEERRVGIETRVGAIEGDPLVELVEPHEAAGSSRCGRPVRAATSEGHCRPTLGVAPAHLSRPVHRANAGRPRCSALRGRERSVAHSSQPSGLRRWWIPDGSSTATSPSLVLRRSSVPGSHPPFRDPIEVDAALVAQLLEHQPS